MLQLHTKKPAALHRAAGFFTYITSPDGEVMYVKKPSPEMGGGLLRVRLLVGVRGPEDRLQLLAVRIQQLPGALQHPVRHRIVVGRVG